MLGIFLSFQHQITSFDVFPDYLFVSPCSCFSLVFFNVLRGFEDCELNHVFLYFHVNFLNFFCLLNSQIFIPDFFGIIASVPNSKRKGVKPIALDTIVLWDQITLDSPSIYLPLL
jgi:hypothetical protein